MWLPNWFFRIFTIIFLAVSFIVGFAQIPIIQKIVSWLIVVYLLMVLFRTMFFFFGAFKEKYLDLKMDSQDQSKFPEPMVSIIVPAFNEATDIGVALKSLAQLDYNNYEVIVVDDGSRDATAAVAMQASLWSSVAPMQVVSQPNSGKAAALNHGVIQSAGNLIVCVDADSKLTPNSIKQAVRHFTNEKVGAVAGFIDIANQDNLLLKLQQLEYLVGLNFTRRALSFMGIVPIVPGPAGMFRKKALLKAGGFRTDGRIFAEDAELSLRILNDGWEIHSEEDMVAITEAPVKVNDLLRQRYRWNRGTYQALKQNIGRMYSKGGIRGIWLGSYLWGECVVTPFLNMGLILYFLGHFLRTGELNIFTTWYVFLLCLDAMTTVLVTHKQGRVLYWLSLTLINKFYYYYMLLTWRLLCLHEEWADEEMTWDKLDRVGGL